MGEPIWTLEDVTVWARDRASLPSGLPPSGFEVRRVIRETAADLRFPLTEDQVELVFTAIWAGVIKARSASVIKRYIHGLALSGGT